MHIYASSGIRTRDPSVRRGEDVSCLRAPATLNGFDVSISSKCKRLFEVQTFGPHSSRLFALLKKISEEILTEVLSIYAVHAPKEWRSRVQHGNACQIHVD
jgi:hypothetical protein